MATNESAEKKTTNIEDGHGDSKSGEPNDLVTDRFAQRAHTAIDRASEIAGDTEEQLRRKVAAAEAQLSEFRAQAKTGADQQVGQVKDYIERKPLESAGIAFAAGLLISRILR
ncbi:MAG: hypothetical protein AAF648_09845 [Pseudomonadota bacterium]